MSVSVFLARHALDDFRHRARLVGAIADGTCTLRELPRALRHSPRCGDITADSLSITAPRALGGAYAESVAEDQEALQRMLRSHAPHHACDLHVFDMVPGFRFRLVECVEDQAVLGCVLDYDPRLTDEETWVRFFGSSTGRA